MRDNFIVSARKYRPSIFASVVGQNHITSTLKNAISRNQLAHAYLFCGPRGVGKTTCARIFAKAINCLSPVDNEACNECESCRSFNDGRSFSIHELDAASNNSVDDIRSLTDQVRIPPQVGRYSVYIIDEVHMLSSAAFNAFLKTLEEPPAHAVFILATTEKHKILPTILSRCQIFDFNRIRVEDMVGYLKYIEQQEGITGDDESLNLIAVKAEGGMRDALSMFDKAVSFCGTELHYAQVAKTLNVLDYDTYFGLTRMIVAGDYAQVLLAFDDVLTRGFTPQTFVAGLNTHFRDLLMCKDPKTTPLLEVAGSLLDKYKQQGGECDTGFLFEAIEILTTLDSSLRTATNQRLNVELGLMKLCGPGQKKKVGIANQERSLSLPEIKKRDENLNNGNVGGAVKTQERIAPPAAKSDIETETRTEERVSNPPEESRAAMNAMPHTISGMSIASLLNGDNVLYSDGDAQEDDDIVDDSGVDPLSEGKILACIDTFTKKLHRQRPRIAMAFSDMDVQGNIVLVKVSNDQLYDEIMRNRTEILSLLASHSCVNGGLELNVKVVKDDPSTRKPIKTEDKLKYMTDKNPALNAFRKALDLDIE